MFSGLIRRIKNRIKRSKTFCYLTNPNREDDLDRINRLIQRNLSTMAIHQKTFPQFKGIYTGRDVAIIATGPSLKQYKPIPGCINIGVNKAIRSGIDLDYVFAHDYYSVKDYMSEMNQYRKGKCIKFYGILNEFSDPDEINFVIPESDAIEAGALRYRIDTAPVGVLRFQFAYDLTAQPLGDWQSTTFTALQFALWTNPRRIYVVGCDCANIGHFDSTEKLEDLVGKRPIDVKAFDKIFVSWHEFKKFANRYYPKTEIVSVNPVGLKGLFTDLYQK